MFDTSSIIFQVKHNCNISDARHWGDYSPCGLLLRLRNLYKLENGLKPWDRVLNDEIGDWISQREDLWAELETEDFRRIEVNGRGLDPFNTGAINSELKQHGLFYAAGYGNLIKPVFFLGELSDNYGLGRYNVFVTEKELARDLSTAPAMTRGDTIILRREAMEIFLWDRFTEVMTGRCRGALFSAFSEYGLSAVRDFKPSADFLKRFGKVVDDELTTYLHHEVGEVSQRRVLGGWWRELLLKLPYSRAELFLRGLKDILSDTCSRGMLSYITENRKTASLSFYVSFLSGFRKLIFPEIVNAYEDFRNTSDWGVIEEARLRGHKKSRGYVKILKSLNDSGKVTAKMIEDKLISKIM
jgi:hypothetical protein